MEVKELTELVNRVKLQQPGAFDLLYDNFKDQAYRTAVFLTGNTEVFLKSKSGRYPKKKVKLQRL